MFLCREYSKQLNDSRIMILQAREDALQGIVKDVDSKLAQYATNKKKYTGLLTDLILQVTPSSILSRMHVVQGGSLACTDKKQNWDGRRQSFVLRELALQAAEKLEEKAVVVVGREEDAAAVKEAAEAAKGKFKQTFKREAPQITVSTDEYLPSGSKGKGDDDTTWWLPDTSK